jgi:chorismate mutase
MVKNASKGARDASPEPSPDPAPDPRSVERAMRRLRENIDQVDSVLVKLLNQRAQWALEIGEVKKSADLPIYQPDREKAVLARVQQLNRGPLGQAAVQRLFERIIDESRRLERIGGEGEGVDATDGAGATGSAARTDGGA